MANASQTHVLILCADGSEALTRRCHELADRLIRRGMHAAVETRVLPAGRSAIEAATFVVLVCTETARDWAQELFEATTRSSKPAEWIPVVPPEGRFDAVPGGLRGLSIHVLGRDDWRLIRRLSGSRPAPLRERHGGSDIRGAARVEVGGHMAGGDVIHRFPGEALVTSRARHSGGIRIGGSAQVHVGGDVAGGDLVLGSRRQQAAPARPARLALASASPDSLERLRVDTEVRAVTDALRRCPHLEARSFPAIDFRGLSRVLLDFRPHMLQISCHGDSSGALMFDAGPHLGAQIVPPEALMGLLGALRSDLKLVVLNACHSARLAAEIAATIAPAIGMQQALHDGDAVEFAAALYDAVGSGRPLDAAFQAACATLEMSGAADNPRLFPG